MLKKALIITSLYSFLLLSGRVFGLGEKILSIGPSWEAVEKRQGIAEVSSVRPQPVLALADANTAGNSNSIDLNLSFNEGRPERFIDSQGCYDVFASTELASADSALSRNGTGAALFNGRGSLVIVPKRTALFAPGNHVRDFSIEFWIYPQVVENGANIVSLVSNSLHGYQRIQCVVTKNRPQWTFGDFFCSADQSDRLSLSLTGPPLLPRAWSHHLIRFDADLGLLEYLVDGRLEALEYATLSGREGGEVYTPAIGEDCSLTLGNGFSGMMDDFIIHRSFLDSPGLTRYASSGGRFETRILDLGNTNSRLLKIEAFGGRTSNIKNDYAGNSGLSFSDYAQMCFFIRINDNLYLHNDVPWVPVNPGMDLGETFRGRYVQIAADFYPGASGETSPYLSELKVIYQAVEPPSPPTQVIAQAKDGAVELSWKASPSRDAAGYMVYYGTSSGEYFGARSPIDAGNRTSFRIEGLNNGTLYYFAVAAYSLEPGGFSREAMARPLRMTE